MILTIIENYSRKLKHFHTSYNLFKKGMEIKKIE